ncbi:hypothetical protein R1sor_010913 [Riccia sorocarpa]|uniref:Uncharacterized protein n=1 Tax=Riccia sorocarpa TaxID=122646 RepID=A0ABD3I334_9MARC
MSENQLAPTFFLEPTPKCYKKTRKPVVEETMDEDNTLLDEPEKKPSTPIVPTLLQEPEHTDSTPIVPKSLEEMNDQTLASLATRWKLEAMKDVYGLIKTPEAVEDGVTPISHLRYKESNVETEKLKELSRGKQAHIELLTRRIATLQSAFRAQEAQAILLGTAYHMCEKPKEVKDLISTKYLETLRSKVEDVTRIMELEALLEASGIVATKRSNDGYTRAFTEVLQAQLGELSRILSVTQEDGPISAIALTEEERSEMLAPVALPTKGDSILSAGSSDLYGQDEANCNKADRAELFGPSASDNPSGSVTLVRIGPSEPSECFSFKNCISAPKADSNSYREEEVTKALSHTFPSNLRDLLSKKGKGGLLDSWAGSLNDAKDYMDAIDDIRFKLLEAKQSTSNFWWFFEQCKKYKLDCKSLGTRKQGSQEKPDKEPVATQNTSATGNARVGTQVSGQKKEPGSKSGSKQIVEDNSDQGGQSQQKSHGRPK